jgi:hypothetical protein
MIIQPDRWIYSFDNQSAIVFLKNLRTDALVTETTIQKCCIHCAAIMRSDCQIDISDISAANSDCAVCALLLRAAKPHWRREDCIITRRKSALAAGYGGPRILRLGTTLGKCI